MPGLYFGSVLSSFGTEFRNGDLCFSATFPPSSFLHGDSCKGQLPKFSCSSNTIDWVALVQPMRDQLSFGLNLTHWFNWLNQLTFVFVLVHPQQFADPVRCVVGIIWRLILVSIYIYILKNQASLQGREISTMLHLCEGDLSAQVGMYKHLESPSSEQHQLTYLPSPPQYTFHLLDNGVTFGGSMPHLILVMA